MPEMKYFVLKPKSKCKNDPHAGASRDAMIEYSRSIEPFNIELADSLRLWVIHEDRKEREMT